MKPSFFSATWFKILLLVAGFILLGSGIWKIYTALKPALPEGYKEALLAVGDSSTSLGSLFGEDFQQALSGLEEKEAAGDWLAAVEIVDAGLEVVVEISSEVASLKTSVANFKDLSEEVKDSEAKEKSLELADLLEQMIAHLEELARLEEAVLEPVKEYYEALAAGNTATLPSNITADSAKIEQEASAITSLGNQVVTATNELFKLLGIPTNE